MSAPRPVWWEGGEGRVEAAEACSVVRAPVNTLPARGFTGMSVHSAQTQERGTVRVSGAGGWPGEGTVGRPDEHAPSDPIAFAQSHMELSPMLNGHDELVATRA